MGKGQEAYKAAFAAGTRVRVAPRETLEQFSRSWKFHNPLQAEQLEFAGRSAVVTSVGFYHGGDVLYSLEKIPGIWHEACLAAEHAG